MFSAAHIGRGFKGVHGWEEEEEEEEDRRRRRERRLSPGYVV